MTTTKKPNDTQTDDNADVQAFLTEPKYEQQRNFMRALYRSMQAEDVAAARDKTKNVGGSFLDNLIGGMTGDLFGEDK